MLHFSIVLGSGFVLLLVLGSVLLAIGDRGR